MNWKAFTISFIGVVIMVFVQHLSVVQQIVSPVPAKIDPFDAVTLRLEQKEHTYKVHKDSSLIETTYAGGEYDGATAYVVADYETGEVILEKNLSKQTPIASITKVMTAVVALDLASVDERFEVSAEAAAMEPSKIMIKKGQTFSLDELLHASLMASANDATEVIKQGIDQKYGDGVFIRAMNEKAKFLRMKNSRFTNAQGLDRGQHYSSVEDLVILSHYALENYPLIKEIVNKDFEDKLTQGNTYPEFFLNNWNGLLGVYPGVSGIKIGNTGKAGYTTSVVAERSGKKLIAITLDAPGVLERDSWTAQLLDTAFEKTAGLEPVNVTAKQLKEKYASWRIER